MYISKEVVGFIFINLTGFYYLNVIFIGFPYFSRRSVHILNAIFISVRLPAKIFEISYDRRRTPWMRRFKSTFELVSVSPGERDTSSNPVEDCIFIFNKKKMVQYSRR